SARKDQYCGWRMRGRRCVGKRMSRRRRGRWKLSSGGDVVKCACVRMPGVAKAAGRKRGVNWRRRGDISGFSVLLFGPMREGWRGKVGRKDGGKLFGWSVHPDFGLAEALVQQRLGWPKH